MISEETLMKTTYYEQPYQKEKDYLQEMMIGSIYEEVDDSLVFKGGTALSKFYGSPRFSDDLDFAFVKKNRKTAGIIKERLDLVTSEKRFEYPIRTMRKTIDESSLSYELSIGGPLLGLLNKYQHLKIEVNLRDRVMLPAETFRRDSKYQDIGPYIAVVMSRKEILAEKVHALLFRHNTKARDLFDLYFLIKGETEVDASFIDKKLSERGRKFTTDTFTRRMNAIGSIWEKELGRLIPNQHWVAYSDAKAELTGSLKEAGML
ncbi:nucleotidyl transferase AbiEii/AbiGii toxin family protein [Candidatus Marsarchaeota archaeon]|jgi:predicted nucleotidyltransferase component of viral defense system|nr:nucleotidyl transferase AbiEii/AbiGii toxin family protein [Candidatus Marsarchaeota archaeon]